jgi:hypothetical protein
MKNGNELIEQAAEIIRQRASEDTARAIIAGAEIESLCNLEEGSTLEPYFCCGFGSLGGFLNGFVITEPKSVDVLEKAEKIYDQVSR